MHHNKRYHPIPFIAAGLAALIISIIFSFLLPKADFLRPFLIIGSCLIVLYGILNYLMRYLSDSPVKTIVNVLRHIMQVCFLLVTASFVVVEFLIVSGSGSDAGPNADYIIVLGAAINGEEPSTMLSSRLDSAYEYMLACPETRAILTGGQGSDEDISEALAMSRYLEQKGISPDRLILEDKASNTAENMRFSVPLIEAGAEVVLVSNEFHLYRAGRLARLNGLEAATLAAPTPYWYQKVIYFIREYFSVVGMFLGRV